MVSPAFSSTWSSAEKQTDIWQQLSGETKGGARAAWSTRQWSGRFLSTPRNRLHPSLSSLSLSSSEHETARDSDDFCQARSFLAQPPYPPSFTLPYTQPRTCDTTLRCHFFIFKSRNNCFLFVRMGKNDVVKMSSSVLM